MYDLFSEFEDMFGAMDAFFQTAAPRKEQKCPVCGHTWQDFKKSHKFGCGECYKTFKPLAESTLRQVHSTSKHTGKIPSKAGTELKKKRQYEELKAKLQEAVKAEDYETAAKLHKQIREMEGSASK